MGKIKDINKQLIYFIKKGEVTDSNCYQHCHKMLF
jgi:hypothetical protein